MPNLEVLQIQKNKFNTEFLNHIDNTASNLVLFDFDGNQESIIKKDLKNLYIDSNTRTAKTIFEDEQAN